MICLFYTQLQYLSWYTWSKVSLETNLNVHVYKKYPISANIFLINHHSMLPLIICNFHVMSLSQQSVFSLLCNLYRNVMVWYYHIPPMTQWIQRKLNSSTIKSSNVAFPIQGDKMDACGIRTYRGHESLERLIMTVRILTSHL